MITEQDLKQAIAECQGQRHPDANTCIKLAAFLTIQRELFENFEQLPTYSFAPEPAGTTQGNVIGNYGGSDFLEAIAGKNPENVWLIMDELMESMAVLQPRIYDQVMRKILNS